MLKNMKPYNIYVDKEANSISPRWWHKLLFWKKYKYHQFIIKLEYKTLKEMIDD